MEHFFFPLEAHENLRLAEMQQLESFKKSGIRYCPNEVNSGLPHLHSCDCVNLSVSLLPYLPSGGSKAGRPGPPGGVRASSLYIYLTWSWFQTSTAAVSSYKGLWQSCLAWLPSPYQPLPITTFLSQRFGNDLETALFVLPTI